MSVLDLEVERFKSALLKKCLVCGMSSSQVFDYLDNRKKEIKKSQEDAWHLPVKSYRGGKNNG